jgi:ABC-2 type transport system ATP-binding protein
VCHYLVAIDGGRLLRAAPIDVFTRETEMLAVEVIGDADRFVQRLGEHGLAVRRGSDGAILITIDGDPPWDLVRNLAADAGVGLLRIARRRDRLEDLFHRESAPVAMPGVTA